jgi:NodT family efflux transporter outer membrane factor (OMF) lipoprotein
MKSFRHNLRFGTAAILLLLAACEVGPDYEKPVTDLPDHWLSGEAAPEAAMQAAWWRNFNDPVLTHLIEMAASGNFDIKIAESRIAGARAARSSAFAGLLPTGNLKGTATREANQIAFPFAFPGVNLRQPFDIFQTGFDASWELDLFGGHRRALKSSEASLEAADATRDDAMVSLLAEVARTYIDIRGYQAQLKIAEDTIALNKSSVDIARQRFQTGNAPRLDLTQAEAQMDQAEAQIPYYRNLLAQAEFSLDVLLGEQPGASENLVATPAPIPVSDKALVLNAPSSVIANRPDIRVAERKLAAATAQQGVAVAQFFPDISVSGFFGLLNTDTNNLLRASSKSWLMSGSVAWPILSYGSLSANLDAADAEQQEALQTYQKTIITALSDVEKSLTAYKEQDQYRQKLEKAVASDRHAYSIAQQRYKEGLTSFLEVLDAERTLYTAESQTTQANATSAQNLVAVYKSLGGGWQSPDKAKP